MGCCKEASDSQQHISEKQRTLIACENLRRLLSTCSAEKIIAFY